MKECDIKQAVTCQITVVTSLVGIPRVPLLRDKCYVKVGGIREYLGAWAVYENHYKKFKSACMYLCCGHMCCRLLVKVSAVGQGMSLVLISWQRVSAYKRKLEYTVYLWVFMSIPPRGRVVIHG